MNFVSIKVKRQEYNGRQAIGIYMRDITVKVKSKLDLMLKQQELRN